MHGARGVGSEEADDLGQRAASASGMAARFSGVSMIVGNTQLTLMRCSRNSADMASVRRIVALLLAV
jgi:hypothetical protein